MWPGADVLWKSYEGVAWCCFSPLCFSVCDWSGGIWADYIKKRLEEAGGGGGVVKLLRDFLVPSGRSSSSGS